MKCKLLAVLMLLLLSINVCCLESPSYYQYSSYFDDSDEWKILTEQEVMGRIHLLRYLYISAVKPRRFSFEDVTSISPI